MATCHDLCGRCAFVSWALRQAEISRKLGMGYHVPFAYGMAIFRLCQRSLYLPSHFAWVRGDTVSPTVF